MTATEQIFLWDVERAAQASFPDRTYPQGDAINLALTSSEEDVSAICALEKGCAFWWTNSRKLDRLLDGAMAVIATYSMKARWPARRWEFASSEFGPSLTGLVMRRFRSYERGRSYDQWEAKRDELIHFLVKTAQALYQSEDADEKEELLKAVFDRVERE